MTINEDTIKTVQETWKKLDTDGSSVGVQIFLQLFKVHPSYQSYFSKMENVPYSELSSNSAFLKHATHVGKKLNFAVNSLDNLEAIIKEFSLIGKTHKKHNFTEEHYKNVQKVIENVLKEALASDYTESVEKAWTNVLTVVVDVVMTNATAS